MARQAARPRKPDRVASPLVLRKSPKLPKKPGKPMVARIISSPVERRTTAKDARNSNTKQTVSAASIFKKKPKSDLRSKKHRKRREETPEPGLFDELQYGFAEARAAIGDQAKATFDDIHASFTERLATTRADDEAFFKHIDKAAKTFSSPLENEMVQTAFKEGGKRVEKVFKVGDRVAIVKKDNEKDETKLIDYWKQWDDVQNEYLELGIDIFGREAFRIETPGQDGGFRKEMALEAVEHDSRVDEFEVEIENIGTDSVKKMEACEKESAATARKDRSRLLNALL
ncbi:hypothetical protein DL95DRAFT_440636 [Leptodontidium sp. 2 PMI_412]|nr:hypothetical protein DL95DRAFT_440636 [Leptodontidium sp. 2 PMI_412]